LSYERFEVLHYCSIVVVRPRELDHLDVVLVELDSLAKAIRHSRCMWNELKT
jgi:hypothetical protein